MVESHPVAIGDSQLLVGLGAQPVDWSWELMCSISSNHGELGASCVIAHETDHAEDDDYDDSDEEYDDDDDDMET